MMSFWKLNGTRDTSNSRRLKGGERRWALTGCERAQVIDEEHLRADLIVEIVVLNVLHGGELGRGGVLALIVEDEGDEALVYLARLLRGGLIEVINRDLNADVIEARLDIRRLELRGGERGAGHSHEGRRAGRARKNG